MKKFATLLPNNWLAETPQTLASRRLGRQSAERERISEISRNVFKEKNCRHTRFLLTTVWALLSNWALFCPILFPDFEFFRADFGNGLLCFHRVNMEISW
ncbi:hypothetical protein [Peribacillus frigoritolerans]|uniref:hypothetical protein n=1 Tax=Peribacillus frigoritolerans TaxID=450367 RepID=UPI0031DC3E49